MVNKIKTLLFCLLFVFTAQTTLSSDPVTAELIHEEATVQPGHPFWVGLKIKMDDHWHVYWKNPGDAGMAPSVSWTLPENFTEDSLLFPVPARFESSNDQLTFGYENEVIFLTKITPPKTTELDAFTLSANLNWVACSEDSCLPGHAELGVTLPKSDTAPKLSTQFISDFKRARGQIPQNSDALIVEQEDELIRITFKSDSAISHALFFPEIPELIESNELPTLKKLENNHYQITLKSIAPINELQGVVALYSETDQNAFIEAFEIDLPVTEIAPTTFSEHEFKGGFFLALGLAFLGGLILNLMPCVLPVISFKIMGFVKMAGQDRKLIFKHGLAFTAGVLVSFWALAGSLLVLQSYGQTVGWGFQLQEPLFVAILASVIFVFGLSLFGVFEMGVGFASKAGQAQATNKAEGLTASFFSGILATAVATPCTGPFLGTAIGFAVTLPAVLAMTIFTSLGLGMASPYLLVGAFPELIRFLPKPGNWMIAFKEIMGFVMLATVMWLIWVFVAQTNGDALFKLLVGFFFLSLGSWIFGTWGTPVKTKVTRLISSIIALTCMIMGSYTIYQASTGSYESDLNQEIALADGQSPITRWEHFNAERLKELQEQGTPVFIDFTAKWCLICQTNHVTLSTEDVVKSFKDKGVVKMKADWTRSDPAITQELKKFGRNGVPLYVLYGSDGKAEIMPQTLTASIVKDYLNKL